MEGMMRDFRRDRCISVQREISGLGRTMGGIRLTSFGLFVLIFSQIEIEQDPVGTETFQRVADQGRGYRDRRGAAGNPQRSLGAGPRFCLRDTNIFELFYGTKASSQWKTTKYLVKRSSFQRGQFDNHGNHRNSSRDHLRPG